MYKEVVLIDLKTYWELYTMSMLIRKTRLMLLLVMLAVLHGCAYQHVKPDPAFAPVRPEAKIKPPIQNGAIYQAGFEMTLFETIKAKRVGDILTVVFDEKHVAKKETKTEDNKASGITLAGPTVFGNVADATTGAQPGWLKALNNSISSTSDFKSKGKSEQKDSLTGSVSVSVTDVLPNGYLSIRGEKLLTLNQGDEFVQIMGIIRPVDVGPDNKVSSSKVANARIVYSGKGMTHDSNQGGWGTRLFLSDIWPF